MSVRGLKFLTWKLQFYWRNNFTSLTRKPQIAKYISWYNLVNNEFIKRLSKKIGSSEANPVWRYISMETFEITWGMQKSNFIFNRHIIAYKNLIEGTESLSVAMVYVTAIFLTGTIDQPDFYEFIRHHSLSQEHLTCAKHFLQRDSLFFDDIEERILKWYVWVSFGTKLEPSIVLFYVGTNHLII